MAEAMSMTGYNCGACNLNFTVGTELEDQIDIVCPLCQTDTDLEHSGEGVFKITKPAD